MLAIFGSWKGTAMWSSRASAQSAALALLFGSQCLALELRALPEFFRPDPFGGIVESDREGAAWLDSVKITAARGGYASFQVSVTTAGDSECQVSIEFPLTSDVYR